MDVINTKVKQEPGKDLCHGCLSYDRALKPVKDRSGIFAHIFGVHFNLQDQESVLLCWECNGIIQKIYKFHYQVQCAQTLLRDTYYNKELSSISLSKFTTTILDNIELDGNDQNNIEGIQTSVSPNKKNISEIAPNVSTEMPFVMPDAIAKVETNNEEYLTQNYDYDGDDLILYSKIESDEDITLKNIKKKISRKRNKIKIEPETEDNDIQPKKTRKGPPRGVKKFEGRAKMVKNPNVDLVNYEANFEESVFNESDMLEMGIKMRRRPGKGNRKPVCWECFKMFAHNQDYRRHQTFCHILKTQSTGPYSCLECQTKCEDKDSLRKHWEIHNATQRCKVCGVRVLNSYFEYKLHSETHKYLLTCNDCDLPGFNVTFNNYKDFGYHFKTLHRRVICDYCGKKSYTPQALAKHIKIEHMPRHCKPCDRWFDKYEAYRRHLIGLHPELANRKETPEIRYCVECDKHYPSYERYRRHLKATAAHNAEAVKNWRDKWIPCPECGKVFKRSSVMKAHYKLFHEKKTDHYCELCDKYLVSAYRLRTHVQGVHMKIRDPKNKFCETCGRGFSSNAVLKKHIRTHTGERPYRCSFCPAAFTQSTPLKSHLKTQHNSV